MTDDMVLSCDIGTSSVKMGLIDREGRLRWYAREEVRRPCAEAWTRAFRHMVRGLPRELKPGLSAVGLSGNGPTLVPLDRRGLPLGAPLLWTDVVPASGPAVQSTSYFLPKVSGFASNQTKRYEKTDCFLPSAEYLAFLLTGNRTAFIPHDGYRAYFWTSDDISRFGLHSEKFPALALIGSEAGRVTSRAAAHFGLPTGLPVYCGGTDFLMALLGSLTIEPGSANDRGGTAEVINYCSDRPLRFRSLGLVPGFFAGTFNIDGFVHDSGRLHSWIKDRLVGRRGGFDEFAALIDDVIPGYSHVRFTSPPTAAGKHGLMLPLPEYYTGADEETGKGVFARAFLEYIGFRLRAIIEELEEAGADFDALHATGGLAKSPRLNQIKATITGKIVRVPKIVDAELLGNAIVAWCGRAEFSGLEEAARALVRFHSEFLPDPVYTALYDDLYDDFASRIRKKDAPGGI